MHCEFSTLAIGCKHYSQPVWTLSTISSSSFWWSFLLLWVFPNVHVMNSILLNPTDLLGSLCVQISILQRSAPGTLASLISLNYQLSLHLKVCDRLHMGFHFLWCVLNILSRHSVFLPYQEQLHNLIFVSCYHRLFYFCAFCSIAWKSLLYIFVCFI